MHPKYNILLASLVVGMSMASGCVNPPELDSTILNRYRASLIARSPQKRGDRQGLALLRPAATIAPPLAYTGETQDGRPVVCLSLQEAITRTLANSPEIRVVGYDPAISREEMVAAAAAFDAVVFGRGSYQRQDEQTVTAFIADKSDVRAFEAGLRQRTVTGGTWQMSSSFTRTWDNSTFTDVSKRFEPRIALEFSQPLLRDGWPEFNLAELRVATLNHLADRQAFRQRVEEIVTRVINQYLLLSRERRALEVQEWLLEQAIDSYAKVQARVDIDATAVQVSQAEAAVADRRVAVLNARYQVHTFEDGLARLIADPQLNLTGVPVLIPTTDLTDVAVVIDPLEQLCTAVQYSPVLEQLRLGVRVRRIGIDVAENQTLPRLDLTGSTAVQGLDEEAGEAIGNMFDFDYLSYSLGLEFEYPLGNRERLAQLYQANFQHRQAISQLQQTADELAEAVRERVRRAYRYRDELQLQRVALTAAKAQLQALEDTETIRGRLTPEFLQLKLNSQQAVAQIEIAILDAIRLYNFSLVELQQLTGTILRMYHVELALPAVMGETDWPSADPPIAFPPSAAPGLPGTVIPAPPRPEAIPDVDPAPIVPPAPAEVPGEAPSPYALPPAAPAAAPAATPTQPPGE